MSNILTVDLSGGSTVVANPKWRMDYGQKMTFTGVELPDTFEVHFSNDQNYGESKTQIYSNGFVTIPDEYLVSERNVFAWVFLHTGPDDGETEYRITIPVRARPVPTDTPPTPQEQSVITETIAALNEGVRRAEAAADRAEDSEAWAVGSIDGEPVPETAPQYHNNAKYYAEGANASAGTATQKASEAAGSAGEASGSASSAASWASSAAGSAQSARQDAQAAESSAERAEQVAGTAGYLDVEINAEGHLIYTKTDSVDVDFELTSDGHLVMEEV